MSQLSLKNSENQELDLNRWDWLSCIYDFKQDLGDKEILWNLSPYIMLSAKSQEVC